ncbi:CLUMA_CG000817, isoform A [Clunio marinus]|uniref:CLUMA_CG000817, isoform A n=1 Tax=Clunio marinus TaxID=568069 RepID=A0A1J1HI63_9DIPT|nr:CLUMA_CG000817, isoform A [Clunio marinus]
MYRILTIGLFVVTVVHGAAISNDITETPRIHTSEQLISAIFNDCFEMNGMSCLKGKVLTYLDTVLGYKVEQSRAFDEKNVDKVIYDRVSRILATNEIRVKLPKIIFGDVDVTYRADRGVDFEVIEDSQEESRGLLKKKLLFPVLLLLKLKMKALMPIFVAIIGLKAMKALILSKLAITIVLGFLISQLVKKTGLGMPMSMMPMMNGMAGMAGMQEPAMNYGPPTTPAAPDSSYGPAAWEPSSSGSSYSRVWEPSASSSSHNLAYSSYYPSAPSSSSYTSNGSSSGASSSSSASSAQTATATAY